MTTITLLAQQLAERAEHCFLRSTVDRNELTLDVYPERLLELAKLLRDDEQFAFNMLVDVCGIDYLDYGLDDWQTQQSTKTGFSRGREFKEYRETKGKANRFAVIYHLLSLSKNHRLRLRVNIADDAPLMVDSVIDIWPAANWF